VEQNHIDIYCERIGPDFWAEPLNAISNLGFIVSAALLILFLKRQKHTSEDDAIYWGLIALVFLIGIGSGLFHTLANRWAMWADIIPITLFVVGYSYLALRRIVGISIGLSLFGTAFVFALTAALPALTALRGSTYLPAVIGMFAVGLFLRVADQPRAVANSILASGCIFALSLGFRTLDGPLCNTLPNGTHFLWHFLNAIVLYILTRTMAQVTESQVRD
jgi:hypothetical protein